MMQRSGSIQFSFSLFIWAGFLLSGAPTAWCQPLVEPPRLEPGQKLPTVSITMRSAKSELFVDRNNKQAVKQFYISEFLKASTAVNSWNGNTQNCQAGMNSNEYQQATEQMINYFRAMAGLPADVKLQQDYSAKALQAALIMDAEQRLSHHPPKTWKCWSETGSMAAAQSNLGYGSSGPGAIENYIEDSGTTNYFVGHRRWIFQPAQYAMGSGSTEKANALWVFGIFKETRPHLPDGVAWPPAGYVPYLFGIESDYRWSFSMDQADFSQSSVRLHFDGKPLSVHTEKLETGYADNTLVWTVSGLPQEKPRDEFMVNVEILNVGLAQGLRNFEYSVRFIDPGSAGGLATSVINPDASKKLIYASFHGNVFQGDIALSKGASVDALNDQGWSALMIAADHGHEAFVDMLLNNNANPHIRVDNDWTALRFAQYNKHLAIAKKIQDAIGGGAGLAIPEPY